MNLENFCQQHAHFDTSDQCEKLFLTEDLRKYKIINFSFRR